MIIIITKIDDFSVRPMTAQVILENMLLFCISLFFSLKELFSLFLLSVSLDSKGLDNWLNELLNKEFLEKLNELRDLLLTFTKEDPPPPDCCVDDCCNGWRDKILSSLELEVYAAAPEFISRVKL